MNRLAIIAALVIMLGATAPGVASAAQPDSWFLSKGQAQSHTRDLAKAKYGSTSPAVSCRPQGLDRPRRGYVYHRWVCHWLDSVVDTDYTCESEEFISGRFLIAGSRDRGMYNYRVLNGMRCND